jgi:protein arginine N-methyltransferase 1
MNKKKYYINYLNQKYVKNINQEGGKDINQEWYDMGIHYNMLRDYNRMNCYYQFIRKNKWLKDKICCDLGSGTGILSLFALLAGVKHIHIVENQKNMINVIKNLLKKHNIEESRYTIHQGWSTEITLPEKVDCIIHELIGMWGNAEQCLGYVAEFRDRNLKQGGKIIPNIVQVDLTLQYTNHFENPIYGANFDYMKDEIDLSQILDKNNYFLKNNKNFTDNILSIIDNDINYIKNTSYCNIETITYNLNTDPLERFKDLKQELNFFPKSSKIISLLSTIRYSCGNIEGVEGDSGKYNTNWRKQILLFDDIIKINPGDKISGQIRMSDLKDSSIEQLIEIKLSKNGKSNFYDKKFNSLSDNKWLFDFDPVSTNDTNESLKKMNF